MHASVRLRLSGTLQTSVYPLPRSRLQSWPQRRPCSQGSAARRTAWVSVRRVNPQAAGPTWHGWTLSLNLPGSSAEHTFSHEVSREVGLEEVLVLEGIVQLGVGHAAALKPAVKDLVYALQGRAPLLAGDGQVVDEVAVQICDLHTSIAKYMKVK